MIVSHRHKFIFLHCRKVAGSSITAFLSRHVGPMDLQLGAWQECFQFGSFPNARTLTDCLHPRTARFMLRNTVKVCQTARQATREQVASILYSAQRRKYMPQLGPNPPHATASQVKELLGAKWDEYYKFCFVRNPYERVVSDYLWRQRSTGIADITFSQYLNLIRSGENDRDFVAPNCDNWQIYTIGDTVSVDRVGRFENVNSDLAEICEHLGLSYSAGELPETKKTSAYDFRTFFTDSDVELASQIFSNEIKHFGYKFAL